MRDKPEAPTAERWLRATSMVTRKESKRGSSSSQILVITQASCPQRARTNEKQRETALSSDHQSRTDFGGMTRAFLLSVQVNPSSRRKGRTDLKSVRSPDRRRSRPPERQTSEAVSSRPPSIRISGPRRVPFDRKNARLRISAERSKGPSHAGRVCGAMTPPNMTNFPNCGRRRERTVTTCSSVCCSVH